MSAAEADKARLGSTKGAGGWSPLVFEDSWLQVNLLRQTIVTGVDTLGRYSHNYYISRYRVTTSLDGVIWNNVTDEEGKSEVKFNEMNM